MRPIEESQVRHFDITSELKVIWVHFPRNRKAQLEFQRPHLLDAHRSALVVPPPTPTMSTTRTKGKLRCKPLAIAVADRVP